PKRNEEREIMERMTDSALPQTKNIFSTKGILTIRKHCDLVYTDDRIKEYILRLVIATRKDGEMLPQEADPKKLQELRSLIHIGASPRASLLLTKVSRAFALLEQRQYVVPDDIKTM